MKGERGGFRTLQREQRLEGFPKDSYKAQAKLADPTRCPECGATFRGGRWTWDPAPAGAHEELCPACRRIRDHFPAGYVELSGEFFAAHRAEILSLVRHCAQHEGDSHPIQRIMAIEDGPDGVLVTTTDAHLARQIAERVHDAHKGSLALQYAKGDNLLRAKWRR